MKKFGIAIVARDYKESFGVNKKYVNKILKEYKGYEITDDEFNPGDDAIYTIISNYPKLEGIRDLIEGDLIDLTAIDMVESDKNGVVMFDSKKELENILKAASVKWEEQETKEQAEYAKANYK